MIHRRDFCSGLAGLFTASIGLPEVVSAASKRPPRILVRSSWQTVNIGDIAHTPGILRILETHLPDAELTLWPGRLDNGVDKLLQEAFPKVKIADDSAKRAAAMEECDFLLHGSGPSLVAEKDVKRWIAETGKPFGAYGITLPTYHRASIETLDKAAFVFFRDSQSMQLVKDWGCKSPIMQFGPDAAFACKLRDDDAAEAFLQKHDLTPGEFLCCIPRLRYTPYWTIPSKNRKIDPEKHARNEAMKEHDHAPLIKAITRIVKETHLKVLLCPEDQTQMQVGRENIYDHLPQQIRRRVVWRPHYWLTGEAISTYVRSRGLFGNEMHSPIMCIGNGVPAIVCRFAEQTSKGIMWDDVGLGDWLFDLDNEDEAQQIPDTVFAMATDIEGSREKVATAAAFVAKRQAETTGILRNALNSR